MRTQIFIGRNFLVISVSFIVLIFTCFLTFEVNECPIMPSTKGRILSKNNLSKDNNYILFDKISFNQYKFLEKSRLSFKGKLCIGQIPPGIYSKDWENIQNDVNSQSHKLVKTCNDYFESYNCANNLKLKHYSDGKTEIVSVLNESDKLEFKLKGIGYDSLQNVFEPIKIKSEKLSNGSKIIKVWSDNLTEWWDNSPNGIEQWFSINKRPQTNDYDQFLKLDLGIHSDMKMSVERNNICFTSKNQRILYNKFKVWDAKGKKIDAHFEKNRDEDGVLLVINDKNAKYPITIDPSVVSELYIKASNTGSNDDFGYSVAIDGNTMVIGAPGEASSSVGVNSLETSNAMVDAGAAYVFIYTGGTWVQQAYLKASNTDAGDRFGAAVDLSGETIIVGSPEEDAAVTATPVNGNQASNISSNSGAVYVFVRNGGLLGTWSQQAYLKSYTSSSSSQFGFSVAIDGEVIVVGQPFFATNRGRIHLFERVGTNWNYIESKSLAASADDDDFFGREVDISGETVVVGSYGHDGGLSLGSMNTNASTDSGSVFVYVRNGSVYDFQAYLKNTMSFGPDLDSFGYSVAIDGETIVVGAKDDDTNHPGVHEASFNINNSIPGSGSGCVFIYVRTGTTWAVQSYIKAEVLDSADNFGQHVAISGDIVLVSTTSEDSNSTGVNNDPTNNLSSSSGAVWMYKRTGGLYGTWAFDSYIKASNTNSADFFGRSIATDGNKILVGASGEDSNAIGINGIETNNSFPQAGAAYTFLTYDPLGVVLVTSFVLCENNEKQFNWVTSSERDIDVFLLEGSNDGINYFPLEEVDAIGNSTNEQVYSSKKHSNNNLNYFRLSTKDINGEIKHEIINEINNCISSNEPSVFPNPVKNILNIKIPKNNQIESVSLYSFEGKFINSFPITLQTEDLQINLYDLRSGVYYIIVNGDLIKFFKNE